MQSKLVCIHKDGVYSIFLAKDNFKGVAVQTAMQVDTMKPNANGELVNHRCQVVIQQDMIPTMMENSNKNQNFEQHLTEAVDRAREKVSNCKVLDKEIDGVLEKYMEQHKKLNESEEE